MYILYLFYFFPLFHTLNFLFKNPILNFKVISGCTNISQKIWFIKHLNIFSYIFKTFVLWACQWVSAWSYFNIEKLCDTIYYKYIIAIFIYSPELRSADINMQKEVMHACSTGIAGKNYQCASQKSLCKRAMSLVFSFLVAFYCKTQLTGLHNRTLFPLILTSLYLHFPLK